MIYKLFECSPNIPSPDAFSNGFTGIINHRFLTNQITRTISVILVLYAANFNQLIANETTELRSEVDSAAEL